MIFVFDQNKLKNFFSVSSVLGQKSDDESGESSSDESISDDDDIDDEEGKSASGESSEQPDNSGVMNDEEKMETDDLYHDASQDVSAPSIASPCLKMHEHELNVVSIGSSNMRNIEMKGDVDLKINFDNLVSGGISHGYERLDEITDPESVGMVILNIGAANFRAGTVTDEETIKGEYLHLIDEVREVCPDVDIIVSSVLPRSSKRSVNDEYKDLNENILSFNNELSKISDDLHGVNFCDNYTFVMTEEWTPRDALYKDDVHLKPRGQEMLSAHLFNKVKDVYFKSKLSEVLDCPAQQM